MYVCMNRLLMDPVTAQKVKPIVYLYGLRDLVEDKYIPTSLVCMRCCIYVSECVRTDVCMYVCMFAFRAFFIHIQRNLLANPYY